MTLRLFTPRARREILEAVGWVAAGNPNATRALLETAITAIRRITEKPSLAVTRPGLAPTRFRFWPLRGFPYLLVVDAGHAPPVIARVLHQSQDLPAALRDLTPPL